MHWFVAPLFVLVLACGACSRLEGTGELTRDQCLESVRKRARLESASGAEQTAEGRGERARVEQCLRSGTRQMYECVERARDLGELKDCDWKGR